MNTIENGRDLPKWPEGFTEAAESKTVIFEGRKYEHHLCERSLDPYTRLIKIIAAVALTVLTGFMALFFASTRKLWQECLTGKECRSISTPTESPEMDEARVLQVSGTPLTPITFAEMISPEEFPSSAASSQSEEIDSELIFFDELLPVGATSVSDVSSLSTVPEITDFRGLIAELQTEWNGFKNEEGGLSLEQRKTLVRLILSNCSDLELIQFLEKNGICTKSTVDEKYCQDAIINRAFSRRKATWNSKALDLREFYVSLRRLLTNNLTNKCMWYSEYFWEKYTEDKCMEERQAGLISLLENMITDPKLNTEFILHILAHESLSSLLQFNKLEEKFKAYRGQEFSDAFEEYQSLLPPPNYTKLGIALAGTSKKAQMHRIYNLIMDKVPVKEIINFCFSQAPDLDYRAVIRENTHRLDFAVLKGMPLKYLPELFSFHSSGV